MRYIDRLPCSGDESASVIGPFHVDFVTVAQLNRLTGERGVHAIGPAERDETIVEHGRSTGPVVTTHDPHVHHFTVLGKLSPQMLGRGGAQQLTDEQLTVVGRRTSFDAAAVGLGAANIRSRRRRRRRGERVPDDGRDHGERPGRLDRDHERLDELFRSGHHEQLVRRAPDRVHRLYDRRPAALPRRAFEQSAHLRQTLGHDPRAVRVHVTVLRPFTVEPPQVFRCIVQHRVILPDQLASDNGVAVAVNDGIRSVRSFRYALGRPPRVLLLLNAPSRRPVFGGLIGPPSVADHLIFGATVVGYDWLHRFVHPWVCVHSGKYNNKCLYCYNKACVSIAISVTRDVLLLLKLLCIYSVIGHQP